MKRIGTTTGGGALVEFTRDEVAAIQTALELLDQITAEVEPDPTPAQPVPVGLPATLGQHVPEPKRQTRKKPAKRAKATAAGVKTCTLCGKSKPVSEFYTGHGKCKPCFKRYALERRTGAQDQKEERAKRRAIGLNVVEKVTAKVKAGGTFLPRERDPELDRPVDGSGRVARVGGEG